MAASLHAAGAATELDALIGLDDKIRAWSDIVKIGRTHLQDAVPLRLSDEVSAAAEIQLGRARRCLADCLPELCCRWGGTPPWAPA